ncbi:type VI secretion system baseplate subunit TssE [Aureimonas sp. ME7]|uniref:type VI secretion system baseplate subunit TssE n=1 Tax=Aureimonas sp. ME7 TaxID=2744252 RepID=UPI0015F696B6|nr:type VI secretion system baseplate subunit TssE [Aureimonas sp. ME7]
MADPLDRYRPTAPVLARSLLDRLCDADPDQGHDAPQTIGQQMSDLRESLRRDLERLLNTRRPPASPPAELDDLKDSLVAFGTDGFFVTGLVTDHQRAEFAAAMERRIRLFEPRLSDLSVSTLPPRHPSERSLRLRIEAVYRAQEGMPPIAFETAVDPSTQRFRVEASRG